MIHIYNIYMDIRQVARAFTLSLWNFSSRSNAEETLGIARDFRKKSPRW